MIRIIGAILCGLAALPAMAKMHNSPNVSGIYACSGSNELVGDYQVKVTMKLKRQSENGEMATYDYITETENNLTYRGQALVIGTRMSVTLTLVDGKNIEFSTGTAEFKKLAKAKTTSNSLGTNRWSFKNSYYESDDTGGNYGTETCVMQSGLVGRDTSVKSGKVSKAAQAGQNTRQK